MGLLDALEKGLYRGEDPDALAEGVVRQWHAGNIPGTLDEALGLTLDEDKAWGSFGARFRLLLEWRLRGWPSTCGVCGKPIGEEDWAVFRKDDGSQVRTHLSCWLSETDRRKAAEVARLSNADEDLVAKFFRQAGLVAVRFSKEQMRAGSTPDFSVLRNGSSVGFCEVKSFIPWEDFDTFEADDPTFDSLSDRIHKAVSQLDSVNPDLTQLSILAIVNHEDAVNWLDLRSVLTGDFISERAERYPIYVDVSQGRIRAEKWRIDLYLWFDQGKSRPFMLFNNSDELRFRRACDLMGVNPVEVRSVAAF